MSDLPSTSQAYSSRPKKSRYGGSSHASYDSIQQRYAGSSTAPFRSRYTDELELSGDFADDPAVTAAVQRYANDASIKQQGVATNGDDANELSDTAASDHDASVPEDSEPAEIEASSPAEEDVDPDIAIELFCTGLKRLQLSRNLSNVDVEAILQLVSSTFGWYLRVPSSLHRFQKILKSTENTVTVKYTCAQCDALLDQQSMKCPTVGCPYSAKPCQQYNSGYATLSISNQLQRICRARLAEMIAHASATDETQLDIVSSQRYRQLNPSNPDGDTFWLNLILHTDDAPLQESTTLRINPCQLVIAELPPAFRQSLSHAILAAVSINKRGTKHALLLEDVVSQLDDLERNGFALPGQVQGISRIKARLLFAICDLAERPKLLNMKKFNGYYGCSFCLIHGEKRGNSALIYPGQGPWELRTPEHYRDKYDNIVPTLQPGEESEGFFPGRMPLPPIISNLPYSMPLDTFHLCFEGTLKLQLQSFLKLHRDPRSNTTWRFMTAAEVARVDELIQQIRWPSSCTRHLRPLSEVEHWKGQEFRNCLLALPVFLRHLSDTNALNAFACYVSAIRILHSDILTDELIDQAERLLHGFHASLVAVYGRASQRANAHMHLHLAEQARQYGPLWSTSTFMFEAHIGSMEQLLKGTRGFLLQLASKFTQRSGLEAAASRGKQEGSTVDSECVTVGILKKLHLSAEEYAIANDSELRPHIAKLVGPSRVKHSYVLFAAKSNARLQYSGDRYVCLRAGNGQRFGEILNFLLFKRRLYAFVRCFAVTGSVMLDSINPPTREPLKELYEERLYATDWFEVDIANTQVYLVRVKQFMSKCLLIPSFADKYFVTKIPRHIEHS